MNIIDDDELTFTDGGTIADDISGSGHVTFTGFSQYIITGNLTQTGGTTIHEGAILVGNGGTTGFISGDIVSGVATDNSGINFDRSDNIIVSGNISGLGYVAQYGTGTLTLTGNNTYGAYTAILQGTLAISSVANLGAGDIKMYAGVGGTLQFNASFTLTQNISLGGGWIDTQGNNDILSGTITTMQNVNLAGGYGGFTKLGAGTLTLTGTNSYLGPTVIAAGTLQIGNGGTAGSLGAGAVTDNSSLVFNRSDNITIVNAISGSGTLIQASNGALTLTGSSTFAGEIDINTGSLALSGSGSIAASRVVDNTVLDISQTGSGTAIGSLGGTGTVALGGRTLTISNGTGQVSTGVFSGVIADGGIAGGTGGSLVIRGGTQTLAGNNTYTGTTTISAGTLQVGNGGTVGSLGAGAITDNSILIFNRSDDISLANAISGSGSLVISGGGAVTIAGVSNNYTGGTVINSGTLRLGLGGSLASTGALAVNGGIFDLNGHTQSVGALSGTGGSIALGSGNLTTVFTGTSTLASAINGSGGLTTQASGKLILTGANTYTGGTTLNGGTLQIGNGGTTGSVAGNVGGFGTLAFSRSDAITFGGIVSGDMVVRQDGAGTTTLTGANTYGIGTIVNAGTLRLGAGGTLGSGASLTINGGTLDLNNINQTVGAATGTGGSILLGSATLTVTGNNGGALASVISGTGGVVVSAGGLRLAGDNTYTGGTTIASGAHLVIGNNTNSGSLGSGNVVDNGSLDFDRSDTDTIANTISGTGVLNLVSGTIALTGANSYGQTNIGVATALNIGNGGTTGTLGTGAVSNLSALSFNRTDSFTIGNDISGSGNVFKVNTGTATLTGTNTYSGITVISGGVLVVGNGGTTGSLGSGVVSVTNGATLTINRSDTVTLSNSILSATNGILAQSGGGTTILTGANTYNGGTTISAGTLQVGNGGTSGTLGSGAIINNASLVFNRSDTFTLNNNSSGTGSLTQAGSGTLILNATHTYSGGTVINSGGTLQVGSGGVNGTLGGGAVTNNGTLVFNHSNNVNISNVISGSGSFSQFGGTITLTGMDTYTGATSVNSGALTVDGAIASSTVTVASGATLGGTGTVGATTIQSGGTLAPGDAIGTLQVNGNLTLTSGAIDAEEISSSAADEIMVSGSASIAGTLTENFAGGSYGHQTFTILHATGALSGTFANVSVTGLPAGLNAQLSYDDHNVYLTTDTAPVVTTANLTERGNQTLALSSLFTVSDADGDAITRYQIWDGNADPASGYFVVGGVVQAARTVIDISAAQLSQASFVTGSVGDILQIRAFDGIAWSAADSSQWSPFTITVPVNHAPVVTTSSQPVSRNQTLAASSLFTVSDADGDAITRYQLWDGTADPGSGHFVLNGVAQPARTVIDISAAQLAQTSFVTGSVGDTLQIRAFDGIAWSAADNAQWSPFTLTPTNNAPVVTTSNLTRQAGQTLAAFSFFTVSDADGDSVTRYQLWDASADPASGYFTVNGVAQAARTVIDITAAQLAQTSFVTGTGASDALQIRAFDGIAWSAADNAQWSPFTVTVPVNHPPVVTTSTVIAAKNQTLAASSLFTVSDADSDAITKYQLWDATADPLSGHFVVNGVTQAPKTVIEITASQLAQTSFVTGNAGDALQIRAFDGTVWSAADNAQWAPFAVTLTNNAPVVTTSNVTRAAGQTLATSSLFSVSDADGDTLTKYQLWDATANPLSGHFVVNGVAQAPRTVIDISATQLAQTSFVTGSVGDSLQVRAFDGTDWSAADNAQWAPFTVSIAVNHPPVVTTTDVAATAGQTLAASSLFMVSDADGDTITKYQLWDGTTDPSSGNFLFAGMALAPRTVIEISASQLGQVSFMAGSTNDMLQIRAFDGQSWSAVDNAQWAPFNVTVPLNHPPVVTTTDVATTAGQSLLPASLFTVSDADGDAITEYQIWDGTADPSSGHFVLGGVAQAARTVIDIPASQLGQLSFLTGATGDMLQVRAFDGKSWSAADSAQWSPFHVAVS